jgi:hypothetical protein
VAKPNATGRRDDAKHVRFYRYLWLPLLERLDGNAFKSLFYMLTFEDGTNNGNIYMGARTLAEGIHVDKKTALRCLQHLDRQGFIRPEQLGYFQQKGGPATRWRFTFLPANGKPPTNEWRQPPAEQKSWEEIFPEADGEIPPAPSVDPDTVGKTGSVDAEIRDLPVGEKGTQIIASSEGDPVAVIRSAVCEWWRLASAKQRLKLAEQHKLQIGELLDFIGGGELPFPKLVAIRASVTMARAAA